MRESREGGGISEEVREILKSIYKCQININEGWCREAPCDNSGSKRCS